LKIAFFHHTLRLGSGIDTVIYELANRLSKYDDVTVFCFNTDYQANNCKFHIREIKSTFANSTNKMMVLAPFIMDKIGPLKSELKNFDVINTHHYPASYIVRALNGPLNLVTEWSAVTSSMFSTMKEKSFIMWLRYANKKAAENADLLLAPCEFVRKWILQHYSIQAVTIFLDGINFEIFDRSQVRADTVFRLYPVTEKKKIILFVGRITESKNIHSLIEAFSIVKKRIPDVVLILVGNYKSYPDYYSRLVKLVKRKNLEHDVIFTGIVSWEDLPSFFAASTIYATCSLWEGFLRAESYAFAKPIVCFNVAANSETVRNEETGYLIDQINVHRFAERMSDLLINDNVARQMGENGYQWAKDNLDFETVARKFRLLCEQKI
jgi:glycosyltransferase involved in cell wall biosynthesis